VSEDVTEHRRLEADLRRAQEDLESRIKMRTRQLETANRELAQFAHLVAHDLKAPLRAVSHLADWVARDYAGNVDVKGHELLGLLRQRVRYMHDLIEGALAYTRLGQGTEPDIEINVDHLVRRVWATLDPPSHIRIHLPSDLPQVRGVPERLQQVFQNLLDNAIKFMDKPEGVIILRAIRLRDAWQFAVADNGPGIEPRYHGRVFGLFQRLRPESRPGSTGLGLALVKKIVERRGGEISLDSAAGQGATFTFTWPDKPLCSPPPEG
jgi:signal transduction histidine kinase